MRSWSFDSVRKFLGLYAPKPTNKDDSNAMRELLLFEADTRIQEFDFDEYCDYNKDLYDRYSNWAGSHGKPLHVVYFEYVV